MPTRRSGMRRLMLVRLAFLIAILVAVFVLHVSGTALVAIHIVRIVVVVLAVRLPAGSEPTVATRTELHGRALQLVNPEPNEPCGLPGGEHSWPLTPRGVRFHPRRVSAATTRKTPFARTAGAGLLFRRRSVASISAVRR